MQDMMLRFVMLRHKCPPDLRKPSHWDFMLEWDGVLRTWELRELPETWADALGESSHVAAVSALPLPDHRLAYLDFEGTIDADRGSVHRCDRGTYELLESNVDMILLELKGELLQGTVRLAAHPGGWILAANDPETVVSSQSD